MLPSMVGVGIASSNSSRTNNREYVDAVNQGISGRSSRVSSQSQSQQPQYQGQMYNVISNRINNKGNQNFNPEQGYGRMESSVSSTTSLNSQDINKYAVPPRPPRKNSRSGSKQKPGSREGSRGKPIAKPNLPTHQ